MRVVRAVKATGKMPVPPGEEQGQAQLGKELAEFSGGLAYDQARVIERTQEGLRQGVQGFYQAGLGLILIFQHEGAQTSALILEKFFPGISQRSAQCYMQFARAASTLPNFRAFCLERGGYSKGLTMLQAASEEQVQEFDETGVILGYSHDQIDAMSVLSLKKALRRAREYAEQKAQGAGAKSAKQLAAQAERIRDLEAQVPAETPVDAAMNLIRAADAKIIDGLRLLAKLERPLLAANQPVRDLLLLSLDTAIAIAKMLVYLKSEARLSDEIFVQTCLEVLNIDTAKVTRAGQSLMPDKVLEVVQRVCQSRGRN
ncbi:MAG: hypothetical protein ACLPYB_12500 [Desulfobaccales bacterium]